MSCKFECSFNDMYIYSLVIMCSGHGVQVRNLLQLTPSRDGECKVPEVLGATVSVRGVCVIQNGLCLSPTFSLTSVLDFGCD